MAGKTTQLLAPVVVQLDQRDPFVSWQGVDVQFPDTANTDFVIRHNLDPQLPHDVHYRVIKQFTGGTVYESVQPDSKEWTNGYIVLRSDTANWTGRILLGLVGKNLGRFHTEDFDIPDTTGGGGGGVSVGDKHILFSNSGSIDEEAALAWDYTTKIMKIEGGQLQIKLYDNGNSGAAATIDWANGNDQIITLTANCVLSFANPTDGGRYCLLLVQDGTGSRTVTWPTEMAWNNVTTPTLSTTPGRLDLTTSMYVASLNNYIGAWNLNYQV